MERNAQAAVVETAAIYCEPSTGSQHGLWGSSATLQAHSDNACRNCEQYGEELKKTHQIRASKKRFRQIERGLCQHLNERENCKLAKCKPRVNNIRRERMHAPSLVIIAELSAGTLNSSAANFKTAVKGAASGTLSTLNGNFGSLVSVILKETLAPVAAGAADMVRWV